MKFEENVRRTRVKLARFNGVLAELELVVAELERREPQNEEYRSARLALATMKRSTDASLAQVDMVLSLIQSDSTPGEALEAVDAAFPGQLAMPIADSDRAFRCLKRIYNEATFKQSVRDVLDNTYGNGRSGENTKLLLGMMFQLPKAIFIDAVLEEAFEEAADPSETVRLNVFLSKLTAGVEARLQASETNPYDGVYPETYLKSIITTLSSAPKSDGSYADMFRLQSGVARSMSGLFYNRPFDNETVRALPAAAASNAPETASQVPASRGGAAGVQ